MHKWLSIMVELYCNSCITFTIRKALIKTNNIVIYEFDIRSVKVVLAMQTTHDDMINEICIANVPIISIIMWNTTHN